MRYALLPMARVGFAYAVMCSGDSAFANDPTDSKGVPHLVHQVSLPTYEGVGTNASVNRRLAYLRDPARTFEERLDDFLVYTNLIPADEYLKELREDRNGVLAKARELSEIQLQHFESFNDKNLRIPSDVDDKGFHALESLVYAGDPETLQKIERLWNENLALGRFSPQFAIVLCRPDQPKTALIIGKTLDLGYGLLDERDDNQLKAKLNDPKMNERFLRVRTAALRFAEAVIGDRQLPPSARAWFQDESRRFDDWYLMRRGNDENYELARMRWKHARAWYLVNKAAITEGRYAEVRAPAGFDSLPDEGIEQAKGRALSDQRAAADPSAPVAETMLSPKTASITEQNQFWVYAGGVGLVTLSAFVITRRLMRNRRSS